MFFATRISLLLLLGVSLSSIEARRTMRPRRTTTSAPSTTLSADRHQHVHHWPALVAPSRPEPQLEADLLTPTGDIEVMDDFDQRSSDGRHEFRYELSNGNTRYERTYWLPVGKDLVLARSGYYSVPLPNAKFSTVFYRADHEGFHVDSHTLSSKQPQLPRTLDVPHVRAAAKSTSSAKRNSISVPERSGEKLWQEQKQQQHKQDSDEHLDAVAGSTKTQTSNTNPVKVQADVDVDAVADAGVQAIPEPNSQKPSQNGPSTVAKSEDILAVQVGTAAADDELSNDNDDVTASNINVI